MRGRHDPEHTTPMPNQLSLFGSAGPQPPALPDGFRYAPDVIGPAMDQPITLAGNHFPLNGAAAPSIPPGNSAHNQFAIPEEARSNRSACSQSSSVSMFALCAGSSI